MVFSLTPERDETPFTYSTLKITSQFFSRLTPSSPEREFQPYGTKKPGGVDLRVLPKR